MGMKMKNRSYGYDINRPSSRHIHKYSKYEKCLSKGYLCFPAPGPNLYLTAPAPNLYFTAPALNLCLPVLRFTVKVCYSYSVYLYKPLS